MESYWTVSVRVTTFGIKTSLPLWVCGLFISDRLDVSLCLPVKRHLSTTIYQSNGYYWHQDKVDRKRDTSSSEIEREKKKRDIFAGYHQISFAASPGGVTNPTPDNFMITFSLQKKSMAVKSLKSCKCLQNQWKWTQTETYCRQVEPQENLICSKTPQRSHRIRHISLPTYSSPPLSHVLFFILRPRWLRIEL